MSSFYTGCSGYYYKEWKGAFYPLDIPQSKWLEYYCTRFNSIEINASFYRFPTVKSLHTWHSKTPSDFVFAVKANQGITHFKKFKDCKDLVEKFYDVTEEGLKEKLGIILFQLPPSFSYTEERLENILTTLDTSKSQAIEFRHVSWWNEEVYKILKRENITFCNISHPTLPQTFVKTSPVCYLRFHGVPVLYKSAYSVGELKSWAEKVMENNFDSVYTFFNNTWGMAAIGNAIEYEKMLK